MPKVTNLIFPHEYNPEHHFLGEYQEIIDKDTEQKSAASYSHIYYYDCDICKNIKPPVRCEKCEDEDEKCDDCAIDYEIYEKKKCKICGTDCIACNAVQKNCKKCKNKDFMDEDVCGKCSNAFDDCKQCENGKRHGRVKDDLNVYYSDLVSNYGLGFSPGKKMYGKASIGVDIDYTKYEDHNAIFADSIMGYGEGDGFLAKLRMRTIELWKEKETDYPEHDDEPKSEKAVYKDFKSFAKHIKFPPTEAEKAKDKEGKLEKAKKIPAKYFKIKYYPKTVSEKDPDYKEISSTLARYASQGLKKQEKPKYHYCGTKFGIPNEDFTDVIKENYLKFAGQGMKFDILVTYTQLYIGTMYSNVEKVRDVIITQGIDNGNNSFVNASTVLDKLKRNSEQDRRMILDSLRKFAGNEDNEDDKDDEGEDEEKEKDTKRGRSVGKRDNTDKYDDTERSDEEQ